MSRYQVGNAHTKEPHPDAPPEGFGSATAACIWMDAHDTTRTPMWGWWVIAAAPQPARFAGTQ